MSNTSAYGWNIPDNTDLVKDGALAIRTLGNAIDTSMNTALGTRKAGMVLLATQSFSGVPSQSINDVFSATYDNYKIFVSQTAASTTLDLQFRLRVSGADNNNAVYQRAGVRNEFDSVSLVARNGLDQTSWTYYSTASSGGDRAFVEITLKSPFAATPTTMASIGFDVKGAIYQSGVQTNSTSFTGFSLIASTGNITGTVSVYGVNK
jgi:hypothetical protein